jgi:molybdopterin molybdotransferase
MGDDRFPSEQADWLGVDEALGRILADAHPLPRTHRPLSAALDHVLAQDVVAPVSLPPWDNAAMDGYALRSADMTPSSPGPIRLRVVGSVMAGDPLPDAPAPGHAVRIMTGAPVPHGLDTVVRVEDTDREEGTPGHVCILRDRDRGSNVRAGGEDMAQGDLLLPEGIHITPGRIAILASAGMDPVPVIPHPHVAILPTGDELRVPADYDDVRSGLAIPESNGPALAAACRSSAAAVPLLLPPVPDRRGELVAAVQRAAAEADVLVTTGGASMGTADLMKDVLAEMGFELDFWRVTMRPGSPLSFGHLPRDSGRPLPVFGLPGNPASAFVTFQLLVRPYLLRLAGRTEVHRPVVEALAGQTFQAHPERTLFPRVLLEVDDAGGLVAVPTGPQGSGLVHSLGRAHGLAVVPAGPPCAGGTPIRVILLDDGPAGMDQPGYLDTLRRRGDA